MILLKLASLLMSLRGFITPRQKQKSSAGYMILPLVFCLVIAGLYLTGILPLGLGSLFSLPFREGILAALGLGVAMGAGKDKRPFGMSVGIIIFMFAFSNAFMTMGFLKDNSLQAVLQEKFPVVGICEQATGLWEQRPHMPDINMSGINARIDEIRGIPTPEPSPTAVVEDKNPLERWWSKHNPMD